MTSSILRIIFTTWVASCSCPFLDSRVSNTFWLFMLLSPVDMQSIPKKGSPLSACSPFACVNDFRAFRPEFSAKAIGICSRASANARTAYCSMLSMVLAYAWTARLAAISEAPPPQTMRLQRMRVETTQRASCSDLSASSTIILEPPRTRIVTAFALAHSSITSIFSSPVPKCISLMRPALPSLAGVISSNLGMILAPVAMAMSSMSTPPTHLTAGSLFCRRRWLASSSNPHWQRAMLQPLRWRWPIMSVKYFCSNLYSFWKLSAEVMSMLCLVLGLGASKGQVRMAIRASCTSLGIWGCEKSLSMRMPSMSWVSSIDPPVFSWILISSKFTSFRSRSATLRTALTAISANRF